MTVQELIDVLLEYQRKHPGQNPLVSFGHHDVGSRTRGDNGAVIKVSNRLLTQLEVTPHKVPGLRQTSISILNITSEDFEVLELRHHGKAI